MTDEEQAKVEAERARILGIINDELPGRVEQEVLDRIVERIGE